MLAQKESKPGADSAESRRFRQAMWQATKTQYIFYGWILIRRHEGRRPAATGRAQAGKNFTGRPMEWLLEWESAVRAPGGTAMLLESRPAISPFCELRIVHRVREGKFAAQEFTLESLQPFDSTLQCPGWLAQIVAECDGVRTWRELFAWAQEAGIVAPEESAEEFAQVLRTVGVGGNFAACGLARAARLNPRGVHTRGQARNRCTEPRHSTAVASKSRIVSVFCTETEELLGV